MNFGLIRFRYSSALILGSTLLACHRSEPQDEPAPKPQPSAYLVTVQVSIKDFMSPVNAPGAPAIAGTVYCTGGARMSVGTPTSPMFVQQQGYGWFTLGSFTYPLVPLDPNRTNAQAPELPAGTAFTLRLEYNLDRAQITQANYRSTAFKATVLKRDAANLNAPADTVAKLSLPVPTTPGPAGERVSVATDITI